MNDCNEFELNWFDSTFKNECFKLIDFYLFATLVGFYLYKEIEPLNFEIFMWGDVGLVTDVRFLGVAPHWYFRAYMSWLLLCPHHYIGIFGLIYLMVIIYFQPNLKAHVIVFLKKNKFLFNVIEHSLIYIFFYTLFIVAVFYADSFLPYGRFFNKLFGNFALLFSYFFIFFYLTTPFYKYIFSSFSRVSIF